MDRRRFLGAVAGSAALAGCTGSDETEKDSDGDGVPDSEDYAPNDPDVQSKSDLQEVTKTAATATARTTTATTAARATTVRTTTAERETTRTRTAQTSTPEPTTVDSADVNTLTSGDGWHETESHVTAYSSRSVTAHVTPDGPGEESELRGESVKLLAVAYRYPRAEAVTVGAGDPVVFDEQTAITAEVELYDADVPPDERLHYLAFLAPEDADVAEVSFEELVFVHETDPFVLHDDEVTIERSPDPKELADDSGDGYERIAVEGAYRLLFEGYTQGNSWETNFYIYKSFYRRILDEPRGRSRPEYVAFAQQSGFAGELAEILSEEAETNGFTDKRMQVEFVIDFVQNLPYVPDDVSKGFDDYTKFITETVTEAGGDCEDTSIMLAAVLQSEPFGYDVVLIQPPGHMAVGIYGNDDLPGYYWEYDSRRYYYIETTGKGWGIGDVPDVYQDEKAYIYQV